MSTVERARHPLAHAVDAVLEATVAGSFSRVGIVARRAIDRWGDPPRLDGGTVLVTGATSGIGRAAAAALGRLGAAVHLVGRDGPRARSAALEVEAAGGTVAGVHLVDMGDPSAAADLGARLVGDGGHLDALVHGAGALSPAYRAATGGLEQTVAVGLVGPFALTRALLPLLEAAPSGRMVTVSSGGMYTQRFDLDHLVMDEASYNGVVAYARVKRAQVVLAAEWAERLAGVGISSVAVHPGWVDTPGLESGLPTFRRLWRPVLRTPGEGADTVVWLAAGGAGDRVAPGGIWHDRRRRSAYHLPGTRPPNGRAGTEGGDLWAWCAAAASGAGGAVT
ncbi:MAG: SDR family NAD(P)-dependent oxidoreductase [Actinomycetota bacterium]|nr:SDR family NAD(P)-dependent oxidoreductase [Actinomycetota bacterium]